VADSKISALTATTTADSDELVLARSGTTRKITANNMRNYIRSSAYCKIVDQKAEATPGGTFTAGAWRTRDLNTIQWDPDSLVVSLSANQFVLVAGTYYCRVHCPAYSTSTQRARIYNVTDAAQVVIAGSGQHNWTSGGVSGESWILNRFTIAASKTLRIEHVCQVTANTYGFGVPIGDVFAGVGVEVYTEAEFWLIG
jgi:hypothetical protein